MGYAMQVHHCLPQAIYFIRWHRYHPPGKFAAPIASESEAFSTRGVYERVAQMILFSCTTAVTAPSGSQDCKGEKRAYQLWEPWTSYKSHATALMMCNQTERKGCTGGAVTGIAELSHDLMLHRRRGSWGIHGRSARAKAGASCKIMVLYLIRIKGKD